MQPKYTPAELEAYLDEALPAGLMSAVETALREQPKLAAQAAEIIARRDAGVHSLGGIWRAQRLTCASREQLGSYLLGAIDDDEGSYLRFHLETIGCRVCAANLLDLENQQAEAPQEITARRRKYFESSAGHLRRRD